ncbi:ACP S-malonyltransferase [Roseateles chitinivorans]|uniref:ACP S-malonyltransferase n=1 Tax=Roseateles chitinivorans TaxID=2917965 RepID=UPI003D66CF12
MSVAVVFSGQGNQHSAMLPWLGDGATLSTLNHRLGVPDWRSALADPAWARTNANAQVLITTTALAAWSQIASRLGVASIEIDGIAGYSVGELAACAAAGVIDAAHTIRLAAQRAAFMDEASRSRPGGLLGVTGLAATVVEAVLLGTPVSIAIRNGDDSVVIGGPLDDPSLDAVGVVEAALAARGARCTRLAVSVASHTPLMRPAAQAFASALSSTPMDEPTSPLFDSDGNRVWSADQARTGLAHQIDHTVRWDEVMDQLAARGPSCVLEIGGGQALAKLWQQRHPAIPARSADEFRTLDGVLAWIGRCAA